MANLSSDSDDEDFDDNSAANQESEDLDYGKDESDMNEESSDTDEVLKDLEPESDEESQGRTNRGGADVASVGIESWEQGVEKAKVGCVFLCLF